MSDVPMGAPGAGGQPSEEEIRAYLGQLREAPAEQVVAELLSGLLNAAQVKLGRADARLLIDIATAVAEAGRANLPRELTDQIDQALTQLRLGQVEAERELGGTGADTPAAGETAAETAGTAPGAASGPAEDTGTGPGPAPGQPGSATSRLWIPGR